MQLVLFSSKRRGRLFQPLLLSFCPPNLFAQRKEITVCISSGAKKRRELKQLLIRIKKWPLVFYFKIVRGMMAPTICVDRIKNCDNKPCELVLICLKLAWLRLNG